MIGGSERVVEALCCDLPAHGIDVGVGCLRAPGPVGEALLARGVALRGELAPARTDPRALWALRAHLRRVAADVVYVLDHSNALLYGRLAARLAGVRAQVCAVHRTGRADGRPSLSRADRLLMPLSDRVIAVSHTHARYLAEHERVDPARLVVIHNGVDPAAFSPPLHGEERARRRAHLGLPADRPVIGIVAALRPEKDHRSLLAALAQLRGPTPPHLAVVGDGALAGELREHASALGVGERVRWFGQRGDVPAILACLDALALASRPVVETFPLCVLEAMAACLPVVATDVGSLREMLEEGVSGRLVPPGDPGAMAQALAGLLGAPEAARAMGRRGHERLLAAFTRERMVAQTAQLLRSLASEGEGQRG